MGFEKPSEILNQPNLETNPDTPVRHFTPGEDGKDRFGNRFFKSPELAFTDREGEKSKAGLLISKSGVEFIKSHPGILRRLEGGLVELEKMADESEGEKNKRLERGREAAKVYWNSIGNMHEEKNTWQSSAPAAILKILGGLYSRIKDIAEGIAEIGAEIQSSANDKMRILDIGDGVTLSFLFEGAQSRVYVLNINGDRYVVKVKKGKTSDNSVKHNYTQPYINEMLQLQEMGAELRELMDKNNVVLPEFLFVSSEVSCVKFEEGKMIVQYGVYAGIINRLDSNGFSEKVIEYVKEKNRKESLWSNIQIDTRKRGKLKYDNFILRDDHKLAWIDPLLYFNEELESETP